MTQRQLSQSLAFAMLLALAACGSEDPPPPAATTAAASSPKSPPPSPAAKSLRLNWTANTESDLAGYRIYRSTTKGNYGAPVATVSPGATSYVASGLTPGVTYFFSITAFDKTGNESIKSNEVSASP
jgi:fibronectin type 3 domain-containing protein